MTVSFGEAKKIEKTHIVVGAPGFFKKNMEGRGASLNLAHIKMVCFDEADELFNNQSVREQVAYLFTNGFQKLEKQPQYVLFSATIDTNTIGNI